MEDFGAPTPLAARKRGEWLQMVGQALRDYGRSLPLAHSPLADPTLIAPALVLDEVGPAADERARALRLLLTWGVSRLAPAATRSGSGPPAADDPTWRNPLWWGHHLLRYRYLEPLHPDDFVGDGRFTETLIQLTGIAGPDAYYAERNRAIAALADVLQQHLETGEGAADIRRLALEESLRPLAVRPAALALLELAAIFDGVFSVEWLQKLAQSERLAGGVEPLPQLRQERFVRNAGEELWLSPAIRSYLLENVAPDVRRRRHRTAALLLRDAGEWLRAAGHWLAAGEAAPAAELLLEAAPALTRELQFDGLRRALEQVRQETVSRRLWRETRLLLADALYQMGALSEARDACRQALASAEDAADRGRLFRRLGKLYEGHNQTLALDYYRQATSALPPEHPEWIDLLKDRGWLLLLREDWSAAEADLRRVEAKATDPAQRADILDALAVLHSRRGDPETAVTLGRRALALREQLGDLTRTARSWHNLALAYNALGRRADAVAAYEEARRFFARVGDEVALATTLLSLGAALHFDGQLARAAALYRDCLALCRQQRLPLIEVKAHSNLAEVLAQLGDGEEAGQAWQRGYEMALRFGFADQVAYFDRLRADFPLLQAADVPVVGESKGESADPVARRALELVREKGQVTARQLMAAASVSKATATRRLGQLVESGALERRGRRRGVHYVATGPAGPPDGEQWQEPLVAILPLLTDRFQVRSLGRPEASNRDGVLRLVVDFARPPTLATFFQMERFVEQSLQVPVDLIPLVAARPDELRIRWIGSAQNM